MSRRLLARNRQIQDRRWACRMPPCRWWRPTFGLRGDRGVGLIEVAINIRIAGEGVAQLMVSKFTLPV